MTTHKQTSIMDFVPILHSVEIRAQHHLVEIRAQHDRCGIGGRIYYTKRPESIQMHIQKYENWT